jgi:hypothetical protein
VIGRENPWKRNHWFDAGCESITKAKNEVYQLMQQKHRTQSAVSKYYFNSLHIFPVCVVNLYSSTKQAVFAH